MQNFLIVLAAGMAVGFINAVAGGHFFMTIKGTNISSLLKPP